ncbi:enoyl-CoA hydratase/isomerase family protein [Flavobacterium psychrophilum]|jgi:methylglutaconyl-CoA hydratase|uniref:Enoyl-CoA hydratase/isomerase family protein n=2 Tax=Flavobacterium psychrophilum TaxID=96345 RepID=A6GW26_FLAPJ|nr:enoyl-CoA hydratase/isomerase family protein [Flavobacterium psychrophilum]AIG29110.1 enoyl-CoA hydratase [Flavobacterium psychrophilum]AIG31387.1 enoyl-CoA hydratase [Flavobacterium psychrophilum]AIG33544.1 enoyl-CoA hydratase [Flavobacterium psychrophilum]AIG35911.1 enoyl-CoA hydratase [Flavobacterium psychrophilum]AIG38167.1 enoyl-CoA hydratase [Flavobacterium psychrophilum]
MNTLINPNGFIATIIDNKTATITFSHPASNSFPSNLLKDLTREFNALSQNESVSVIILKSEGNGAFCAGASFDELLSITNYNDGKLFFSGFANVINAMRTCQKIIIGRVQGKAVGGGVGLASACDYVFATNSASVKLSEIAIGIGPFVIEPAVSRKIGKTAMSQLTLAAHDWKTAQWAFENGLYSEIFTSAENLDSELMVFASKLASYNPEALQEMKKVFWEKTAHWDTLLYERAGISGQLVLSDFTKNALSAFKK